MSAGLPLEPRQDSFVLGDWLVQPRRNRLERGADVVLLRPKAMDVLAVLAASPGEVVTKEALLDAVWPGTFSGDGVLSRAVFELREALGDASHEPRYIETVARRGYRLAAAVGDPVPAPPATAPPRTGESQTAPLPKTWSLRRRLAWTVGAATFVLGAWLGMAHLRGSAASQSTAVPRVAVLPFENLGSPTDEYMAVGLAEEISGRLAGLRGLVVVPPSQAFSPGDRAAGEAAIGRRLGADYLVTGGARWDHLSSRVRVTPRVVRVADGSQVWAEVLDRDTADLLGLQTEIAAAIAGRLQVVLRQNDLQALRDAPTSSSEAYRAYLEGRWNTRRPRSSGEGLELAARLQERATALDPRFAEAWAELARNHADLFHVRGDLEPEQCRLAHAAGQRAMALAPHKPGIHLANALVLYWCEKDFDGALSELDQAKGLHADLAEVWEAEAWIRRRQGRWLDAVAGFRAALELSPRDPLILSELGVTLGLMRRFDEALEVLAQARAAEPGNPAAFLAAVEIERRRGNLAAARRMIEVTPNPDLPQVRGEWAMLDMQEGRYEAAILRLGGVGSGGDDTPYGAVDGYTMLGELLLLAGRGADAREAYGRAVQSAGAAILGDPSVNALSGTLAVALAGLGRHGEAMGLVDRILTSCQGGGDVVSCASYRETAARALVMLGEEDRAAAILAELLDRPSWVTRQHLAVDPAWARLRDNPRLATHAAPRA